MEDNLLLEKISTLEEELKKLQMKEKILISELKEAESFYVRLSQMRFELEEAYKVSEIKEKLLIKHIEEMEALYNELAKSRDELQKKNEELYQTIEQLQTANEKLKSMQEKLIQQEKLAAIGKLAGAVAHELRNPLTSIKNIAFYFSRYLKIEDTKPRELLSILSEEIDRAVKIISDLLDFSRVKKLKKIPVSIETIIEETINLAQLSEKINVVKNIPVNLKRIYIDPDKIKQVFLNIITNAVDAMKGEGELKIEVNTDKDIMRISFTDTGCGMSKETMEKIFEPLFTTKAKGLGLGLSIVKDIVELHGGEITIDSEEGKGSTFTISLPAEYEE